jgi:hypothetical protein
MICETDRTSWKKGRVYMKDKINELDTRKNKYIKYLYRSNNELKGGSHV